MMVPYNVITGGIIFAILALLMFVVGYSIARYSECSMTPLARRRGMDGLSELRECQ